MQPTYKRSIRKTVEMYVQNLNFEIQNSKHLIMRLFPMDRDWDLFLVCSGYRDRNLMIMR